VRIYKSTRLEERKLKEREEDRYIRTNKRSLGNER
jgi:hypothetical protein